MTGRRSALLSLALLAPLLWALLNLRLLPQDQGVLVQWAGGPPVDLAGRLQGAWQRLARDCGAVQHAPAASPTWQAARQALADHSLPASRGARPLQVLAARDAAGVDWLLAEVAWDDPGATAAAGPRAAPLDPAIVPLRGDGGGWRVQTEGVWSGDTGPWTAPVFIRRWLWQRVPAMPPALALCLDPQWPVFAR